MKRDRFGRIILTEEEIFQSLYSGVVKDFNNIFVESDVVERFNKSKNLNADSFDIIQPYEELDCSIEKFDQTYQKEWFIPEEYKSFPIKEWLIKQCDSDTKLDRVTKELSLFQKHNMIDLLVYLKYLIDTMRTHNILWGVGRGSSVSSYILYLIGVHKIDSIKYDLDINEFLK